MFQKFNRLFTSFFSLNKSEQRAIIVLLLLIIIISTLNLLLPNLVQNDPHDFSKFKNEIENFRHKQQLIADSLHIVKLQSSGKLSEEMAEQKLSPFPFNPNQLPQEAWLQLGLTEKQVKTIENYESKGGKFNRKEDLKKIYSISEAEYTVLEPYIRIPKKFKPKAKPIESKIKQKEFELEEIKYFPIEINNADSAALVKSLHLPTWIASRIVNYRDLLGGFYKTSQLLEVYGFDTSYFEKIKSHLYADTSRLAKIHINDASFKEILRHPYISYDITKRIVNYRNQRGLFVSTRQLVELDILSEPSYIKLEPYLTIEPAQVHKP